MHFLKKVIFFVTLPMVIILAQSNTLQLTPAQELPISRTYDETTYITTYQISNYNYGNRREIWPGSDPVKYTYYNYHTVYKFSLTSIPAQAYNITAQLQAYRGPYSSGTGKIVEVPDNLDFILYQQCWLAAQNGNGYFNVDNNPGNWHDMTATVLSKLSQGYINFGAREIDNDGYNYGYINITLRIKYDLPQTFTVSNNFTVSGGGNGLIKVDGINRSAPYEITKTIGQSITLEAISPQINSQGQQMIWNTASCNPSEWTRNLVYRSNNQTYPFNVAADDGGKTYTANLRTTYATTSGALSSSETWFNNVSLSGPYDVTVPAGVTLTITECCTLALNGRSIISTGGTINVQSGAKIIDERARLSYNSVVKGICGTIQAAANNAGTSYFINLNSGSFNENVTITNKTSLSISASSGYNQFGTLTLSNCDNFNGTGFGAKNVYLNNGNSATISHLNADGINQSTTGYYFYNSDFYGYNLTAVNSQAGISCYDGTVADIELANLHNNLRGVDSYNGSNVTISNSSFCGTALDLKAYNFSSIYATSCSFDGGTPSISQSSSTVNVQSSTSCPSAKVTSGGQPGNSIYGYSASEDSPENSEFAQINALYFNLNKRLVNAVNAKETFNKESYSTEYEELIGKYKKFLEANPASPLAEVALIAAAKSYLRISGLRGKSNAADMKNFLSAIIENKKASVLKPAAEKLMIDYYRHIEDYTSAVKTAENLIEKYKKDDDYVCNILYTKGLILAHNLNQPDKAIESYSLIVQQYPENPLTALAENELSILGVEVQKNSKPAASSGGNEFSTSNYPNPFNPVTIINYTLPTDENVTIKVYDILGSEIATLVNEQIKAGEHTVSFNAGNLSSGIYFYSIRAGKYSKTMKMILAK